MRSLTGDPLCCVDSLFSLLLLLLVSLPLPSAAISLTGHTVETTFLYPDNSTVYAGCPCSQVTSVVGSGVEVTGFPNGNLSDIDFGDSTILISLTQTEGGFNPFDSLNGWRFSDINQTIPSFTNVLVTTTVSSPFVVTFDADNIWLNFDSTTFTAGEYVLLQLVPEPATATLLGVALVAAWFRGRRRSGDSHRAA